MCALSADLHPAQVTGSPPGAVQLQYATGGRATPAAGAVHQAIKAAAFRLSSRERDDMAHDTRRRRLALLGCVHRQFLWLALAVGLVAAIPATALASAKPVSVRYSVAVKRGVLASGSTVAASATVSDPEPTVAGWWSRKTITAVVQKGVNGGYQEPYSSQGYLCTPVIQAATTSFTCALRGADVATTVRLTFAVKFTSGGLGSSGSTGSSAKGIPIVLKVTNQPVGSLLTLVFTDAVNDPYSTSSTLVPEYTSSAASLLELPKNAIVIYNSKELLTATLQTAIVIDGGDTSLRGTLILPAGATVTISVDGHAAVPLQNGEFRVSLS
jgi:hypothetical protein